MKLQKAKVNNTCLLTAFAMAMDVDQTLLLEHIGTDPNEILWPELLEPQCFRGHHIQEMMTAAFTLGFTITEVQVRPCFAQIGTTKIVPLLIGDGLNRMRHYLRATQGVIRLRTHAVAWDGEMVYDPAGTMYRIEVILDQIESYYIVSGF